MKLTAMDALAVKSSAIPKNLSLLVCRRSNHKALADVAVTHTVSGGDLPTWSSGYGNSGGSAVTSSWMSSASGKTRVFNFETVMLGSSRLFFQAKVHERNEPAYPSKIGASLLAHKDLLRHLSQR